MNYQFHYDKLVERAKGRFIEGYTEKHHIIPKSLGGSNDKENMVRLTAREHFIAHLLLAKIYGGKLIHAAHMLANTRNIKCNNRIYEWLRIEYSKSMSKIHKGRKKPIRSEEHCNNLSKALMGHLITEETLQKMRKSKSEEHKQNLRKTKPPRTEEHIRNLIESRKRNKFDKEMYINMSSF